jgi:hypothetical protein
MKEGKKKQTGQAKLAQSANTSAVHVHATDQSSHAATNLPHLFQSFFSLARGSCLTGRPLAPTETTNCTSSSPELTTKISGSRSIFTRFARNKIPINTPTSPPFFPL